MLQNQIASVILEPSSVVNSNLKENASERAVFYNTTATAETYQMFAGSTTTTDNFQSWTVSVVPTRQYGKMILAYDLHIRLDTALSDIAYPFIRRAERATNFNDGDSFAPVQTDTYIPEFRIDNGGKLLTSSGRMLINTNCTDPDDLAYIGGGVISNFGAATSLTWRGQMSLRYYVAEESYWRPTQ